MMAKLTQILTKLPDSPGIYLYYNAAGDLIYVGKATSLKSRVRSYFAGARTTRPIEQLLPEVADIKWERTDSVLEAVILEAVYIKKYLPKYNVMGKDNKSWNYITIDDEMFPFVATIRQHDLQNGLTENQDSRFKNQDFKYVFGPYPGLNTREVMKILRRLFFISTCQKSEVRYRKSDVKKPCFYYQLGQCLGVCTGEITPTAYRRKVIRPLVLFLQGKKHTVVQTLTRAMQTASRHHDFEEAARLRNQLQALQRIQDVALINKDFFRDVFGEAHAGREAFDPATLRIEGYDISNLGASGKVASLVVFDGRGPVKSEYRKFKIKTVIGQSDVDSLDEVLRRRLRHAEWRRPDIFLIDGGAPQVNRVVKILRELAIAIPVVGIAKGPARKRNDFYLGNKDRPVVQWVHAHQELLIRVRDEAHRFAIAYQRQTRLLY